MKKLLSLADVKSKPMPVTAQEMDDMRRAIKKFAQESRRHQAVALASAKEMYIR